MFSSTTIQHLIRQINRINACSRLNPDDAKYKKLNCENLEKHKKLRELLKRTETRS